MDLSRTICFCFCLAGLTIAQQSSSTSRPVAAPVAGGGGMNMQPGQHGAAGPVKTRTWLDWWVMPGTGDSSTQPPVQPTPAGAAAGQGAQSGGARQVNGNQRWSNFFGGNQQGGSSSTNAPAPVGPMAGPQAAGANGMPSIGFGAPVSGNSQSSTSRPNGPANIPVAGSNGGGMNNLPQNNPRSNYIGNNGRSSGEVRPGNAPMAGPGSGTGQGNAPMVNANNLQGGRLGNQVGGGASATTIVGVIIALAVVGSIFAGVAYLVVKQRRANSHVIMASV